MKKILYLLAMAVPLIGLMTTAEAKINITGAQKMEYKQFGNKYFIRINPNQPIVSTLKEFCKARKITLGTISGLGSLKSVTLGFFDPKTKKYQEKTFEDFLEMASLTGNITMKDGEPVLHLHTVVAGDNYKALAGHMAEAQVSLTAEIIIETVKGRIEKEYDATTGLNLMKMSAEKPVVKK